MNNRLFFRAEARDDIKHAYQWYENRQFGLGQVFKFELLAALNRILDHPELYGRVHLDIRSTRLRRFPYVVHYFLDGEQITVLAVMHSSRDPSDWQSRV